MKTLLLFITCLLCLSPMGRAQIDETGATYGDDWYYADGPDGFTSSTWQRYRNNTGATVNLQIQVETSVSTSWMSLEGDPGVPTANNIAPGATFWLAVNSWGPGGWFGYSEVRTIVGYTTVATNRAPSITWTSAPASVGSGQSFTVSATGHDDDGNLSQVSVWRNGQSFANSGAGNGTDSTAGNTTSGTGPQTLTFTAQAVDAAGAVSGVITHVVSIAAPPNSPPTVVLLSPGAQTVTVGASLTLSGRARDNDGNLVAHNLDIQRPAGDWNFQGGFATGEPYQGGPVGSAGDSTRSAAFTFTDVGTYHIRSGASDGSGWYYSATVAVTVVAPPPVQYGLTVTAGSGGSVTGGGTFVAGSSTMVSATPASTHDFVGWSGDAGGSANPLSVLMDRNKSIQAVFALRYHALVTSTTAGGVVTPGGTYPQGTTVTISAEPDSLHRFVGWAGDAGGTATSVAVLLNGPKSVQAIFADKTAQVVTFPAPPDQPVGGPPLALGATSSSGLPVTYTVLSGPAVLNGSLLQITGPGAVTIQASQPGDGFYLPAPPVTRTFNTYAAATLRYLPGGQTVFQSRSANSPAAYVIEAP